MKTKPGQFRATTIADARKLNLLPSSTTILGCLPKPQLDDWKFRQVTEWCSWNPMKPGEAMEDFHRRVMDGAFQQVGDAADLGTAIHKALECHFQGQGFDLAMQPYVDATDAWIDAQGLAFEGHELRLVSTKYGFAGTTDAIVSRDGCAGILDFKTRKTKAGRPAEPWFGQKEQIASYVQAQFSGISDENFGVNVFISTTEPGRVEAAFYDADDLRQGWDTFQHAFAIWKAMNQYDPAATK